MPIKDLRVSEARTLMSMMLSKVLARDSEVLITGDLLIVIADKTLMCIVKLKSSGGEYNNLAFRYGDIEEYAETDPSLCISDSRMVDKLMNYWNMYRGYSLNNPLLASDNDVRVDDNFEDLLELKSDDGMKFYKMMGNDMNEYLVPMFAGLMNVTKTDGVGINLYDLLDGHLLVNVNIFKKKINRTVNMYFRTLKL